MTPELVPHRRDKLSCIARIVLGLHAKLESTLDDRRRNAEFLPCFYGPHPFSALGSRPRDICQVFSILLKSALQPANEAGFYHALVIVNIGDPGELKSESDPARCAALPTTWLRCGVTARVTSAPWCGDAGRATGGTPTLRHLTRRTKVRWWSIGRALSGGRWLRAIDHARTQATSCCSALPQTRVPRTIE